VESVIEVEVFAYRIRMEGDENDIAERCWDNLELDEVFGYVDGFLDV
jgi:hypothetical protein